MARRDGASSSDDSADAQALEVDRVDPPDLGPQLDIIRQRMADPAAVPEVKKTLVELLFTYEDTPSVRTLKVELLARADDGSVRLLAGRALVEQFGRRPESSHPDYIDPLIDMLRAGDDASRDVAARALAFYANGAVVDRLVGVANDATVPVPSRLAAIDALALHWGNRAAVAGLVSLMDDSGGDARSTPGGDARSTPGGDAQATASADVSAAAMAALRSITGESFGGATAKWKTWWVSKRDLDDAEWEQYRLDVLLDRVRRLEAELARRGADSTNGKGQIIARYAEMQREFLRSLPEERKDARLALWLRDGVEEIRRVALEVITARLGDGRRPEGELRDALFALMADPSPALRREAITVVENLQDAAALKPVLDALARESDVTVRRGLLRALGKLGQPGAAPALIAEIGRPGVDPSCETEAASSLAQLASRVNDRTVFKQAAGPLRARYESVAASGSGRDARSTGGSDAGTASGREAGTASGREAGSTAGGDARTTDDALRSALLGAMAAAAPREFQETFQQAITLDDPRFLVPAIRGLAAAGDASRMVRIRDLVKHADRSVRLAAIAAIGMLGQTDADLEPLLIRLDPTAEPEEHVRSAAWEAMLEVLGDRTVADQIGWAERLRGLADRRVQFLDWLAGQLGAAHAGADDVRRVRELLAEGLAAEGRHADASRIFRDLYETRAAAGAPDAAVWGLRLLVSMLEARIDDGLGELIVQLADAQQPGPDESPVIRTIAAYLDNPEVAADPARTTAVLKILKTLPKINPDQPLQALITRIEKRLTPTPPPPSEEPSNGPSEGSSADSP